MAFLGDLVNSLAIIAGALLGLVVKRGLPEKWQETIMSGIALSIVIIGTKMALVTQNIVVVIVALALGSIIGEILDLEGGMQKNRRLDWEQTSGWIKICSCPNSARICECIRIVL